MKKLMIFIFLALFLIGFTGFALAADNSSEPVVSCDELQCEEGYELYITGEYAESGCEITSCKEIENEIDEDIDEVERKGNKTTNQIKVIKAEQTREKLQERNRLRINQSELPEGCTVHGSVLKCNVDGQRVMAVFAGRSGNTILQVKGINASTKVQLYKENGSFYGVSENNETVLINYFPDQVRDMIRERVHTDVEYEEEIELDEEGLYRVKTKKKARLFYLIPVREKVRAQVDPETGEIIKVRNPWWGFLAKDTIDNDDSEEEEEEETPEENNESIE